MGLEIKTKSNPKPIPQSTMSSTDNTTAQPSSGQSIIDTATSYVQSGIAAVTGNQSDKAKAEQTHNKAAAEANASEAAVKAGPFTLSSSGAVAKDSSERTIASRNRSMLTF